MDRAQAYTLEGTIAAIVVVLAVFYGLQAVDTGPWAGGSDREPDRLGSQAADFLSVTAANGTLGEAVRCYPRGKKVIDGGHIDDDSLLFERQLNHTFDKQGVNYILNISYWSPGNGRKQKSLTSSDEDALSAPHENVGSASYRMTLYDDDPILRTGKCKHYGGLTMKKVSDASLSRNKPYGGDLNNNSQLYSVVEVRLLVW